MRHNTSKQIFSYWDNLRKGRVAPDRRDIEPSDIRELLGDTFILEVDENYRTISFRLAGTKLCRAYGRELKGVGFLALWTEEDNFKIMNAVRAVYQTQQVCVMSLLGETQTGRFVYYEIVMLPLLIGNANEIRILGTATPDEQPYWLGSDSIISNRLKRMRFIETPVNEIATPSLVPDLQSMLSQENTDGSGSRRVGHLTVLDGGKSDD